MEIESPLRWPDRGLGNPHAGRMSGVRREFVAAIELSVLSLGNKNNNNNAWNSAGSFCEQFMLTKEIAQRNWLRF